MTEIEVRHTGNELAIDAGPGFWNDKQLAALRQLGVENASNGDLAVFHHVCQRTGLDPFARQIYMIQREGKQTIQTGIDGFRLVARRAVDRAGETLEYSDTMWCDAGGVWHDVWLGDRPPAAAKVTVLRNGKRFPAVALWNEYVQTKRNGDITSMWASRPAGQLAKCAEALALRKAFPQDLAGVYSTDEMGRHDVVQSEQRRVTAAEITGAQDADEVPYDMTESQRGNIWALFRELGIDREEHREQQLDLIEHAIGHRPDSRVHLYKDEAGRVIEHLSGEAALREAAKEKGGS